MFTHLFLYQKIYDWQHNMNLSFEALLGVMNNTLHMVKLLKAVKSDMIPQILALFQGCAADNALLLIHVYFILFVPKWVAKA